MTDPKSFVFRFGDVEVREREFAIVRKGEAVQVEPTAFRVLLYLLRNPQRLVTKAEIVAAVWGETAVSDNSLTRSIATLRRLLEDNSREPRYIATVQTLGYRLLPAVEMRASGALELNGRPVSTLEARAVEAPATAATGDRVSTGRTRRLGITIATGIMVVGSLASAWKFRDRLLPQRQLREERITGNAPDNPVGAAAISGDGNYLAYTDWAGVHVRLVRTGETRDLETPAELRERWTNWRVLWLPDSTQFFAISFPRNGMPVTWEASVLGGMLRKFREDTIALAASPDGSAIVYTDDARRVLWRADIHGESARPMFELKEREMIVGVEWSADGARLLCKWVDWRGSEPREVTEIRQVSGGPPVEVLPGENIHNAIWLGERRIGFVKGDVDHTNTCNYWLANVDVTSGKLSAKPRLLTHDIDRCATGGSTTADGRRMVFLKQSNQYSVNIAGLKPGATQITPPKNMTTTEAQEFPAAWTPDSQSIIFVSNRNNTWGFYRQPIEGGAVTAIFTKIEHGALGQVFPRVSPDGKWLVWAAFPTSYGRGDRVDLMRVPIEGGVAQVILTEPNIFNTPRCTRLCVFATIPDTKHLVFTSFDPVRGRGQELMRLTLDNGENYGWDISPDGEKIALLNMATSEIRVIEIANRKETVFTVKDRKYLWAFDWTPDGKGFLTSTMIPWATVLHVDLEGRVNVLWEPKGEKMPWALPSPDGRYVAMPYFATESNAWSVEDF